MSDATRTDRSRVRNDDTMIRNLLAVEAASGGASAVLGETSATTDAGAGAGAGRAAGTEATACGAASDERAMLAPDGATPRLRDIQTASTATPTAAATAIGTYGRCARAFGALGT